LDWSRNEKEWTPAPEGLHQAVCVDVEELGEEDTQWGPKEKGRIVWQIAEVNPETGKRFIVSKKYTISLHEQSWLCRDLQNWRGKKYTQADKKNFDPEKLLGVNAQLQIIHNVLDDGRIFANVNAIVPPQRGVALLVVDGYIRKKDRPQDPTKTPPKAQLMSSGFGATPAEDTDDVPF
jgi:hypothetical protein